MMKNTSEISTKINQQANKSLLQSKPTSMNNLPEKIYEEGNKLTPIQNNNEAEFSFDFSFTSGKILESFSEVGVKLGFNLIEEEANHATIIKQRKKRFLDIFSCINFNHDQSYDYTAIKIMIRTNEMNSTRICKIRGLVGSFLEVRNFLQEFKNKVIQLKKNKHYQFEEEIQEVSDQSSNPFHVQVCADYAFYKILSLQNYGLGRKLANSINEFIDQFKNVKQSAELLPLPMKNLFNIIGEVVQNLYKQFNSGRKQMEKIMPYCRISVQKYVCEKLYSTLLPIYQHKYKEFQTQLMNKKQKILNQRTINQIFQQTSLSEKFWLVKQKSDAYKSPLFVNKLHQNRQHIKYFKAAEQLQKIKTTSNIRQKLKYCQLMYTKVKSLVFQFHNGKQELSNMEDILPIIIIVILISDIPNIKCEIQMMTDFISFDPCDQENQKRLLLNLTQCCNYIKRDWKI